jgi:hypothetical protein
MHRGASSAHNLEGRRKCIVEAPRRIITRVLRNASPRPSDVFLFSSTRSFPLRCRLVKIRGGGPIARGDWMAICGRAKKNTPKGSARMQGDEELPEPLATLRMPSSFVSDYPKPRKTPLRDVWIDVRISGVEVSNCKASFFDARGLNTP